MKDVQLNLSIDETNLVLEALGQMPYKMVFDIINKIHRSAKDQLEVKSVQPHVEAEENKKGEIQ